MGQFRRANICITRRPPEREKKGDWEETVITLPFKHFPELKVTNLQVKQTHHVPSTMNKRKKEVCVSQYFPRENRGSPNLPGDKWSHSSGLRVWTLGTRWQWSGAPGSSRRTSIRASTPSGRQRLSRWKAFSSGKGGAAPPPSFYTVYPFGDHLRISFCFLSACHDYPL